MSIKYFFVIIFCVSSVVVNASGLYEKDKDVPSPKDTLQSEGLLSPDENTNPSDSLSSEVSVVPVADNTSPDLIPTFADLVYEVRLMELDVKSPVDLDFNQSVKNYIDVYTIKRRDKLSVMLGLAQYYFPLFEQELDKYDLPMEIKYLAIIESALDPLAKSSSGAVGLWQFLYNTGKMFDLKVDSYIDERRDPVLSTKAACEYLSYLYSTFNDWHLALAAYNGGPGTVKKAIQRSGGKTDYWELRPYLPEQTRGYIPAFIAANYAMNYALEHNIKMTPPKYDFFDVDTVRISSPVRFSVLAEELNIPVESLRFLNPVYKLDYAPSYEGRSYVVLPMENIEPFLEKEAIIYSRSGNASAKNSGSNTEYSGKVIHKVKKGEYLHRIAITYKCTVEEIVEWNNLQGTNINEGTDLVIFVKAGNERSESLYVETKEN